MYINLITIDLCPGQGGGGVKPSGSLEISENGVYDVYSYASASVDVHPSASLSETYISNGDYNITGEFNGGVITVDVPQSVTGFTEKEVTEGVKIVNLSNSASYVHPFVFERDEYLQTVYLPNCISVGENAFASCFNLTSVYIPNCQDLDQNVFANCHSLKNINIEKCLSLNGMVFNGTKISELNLPNCRYMYGQVFYGCDLLVSVSLPKCKYLEGQIFNYTKISELNLPNCIYIRNGVFNYCRSLSSVSLPNCIIASGKCFNECSLLSVLDLPNVIYTAASTFQDGSFTSVSLPNCRYIGGIAFQYCRSLSEELNLPACGNIGGAIVNDTNVTKANIPMVISFNQWYNNPVFCTSNFSELHLCIDVYGCPSYSYVISTSTKLHSGEGSIYVNEQNYSYFISASGWSNISSIIYSVSGDSYPLISGSDGLLYGGTKAVGSNYSIYTNINSTNLTSVSLPNCEFIDANTFINCNSLTSVSLPNCEFIGSYAFESCNSLTSVSLPNCKFIGGRAFGSCSNITDFSLPNCKFIGGSAFNKCSCSLFTSLTLPNCKYIGWEAFYDCKFLSEIYFPGSEVCLIEQGTMWNTGLVGNTLKFYVPASLINEYKTALWWSSMANRIFPIE